MPDPSPFVITTEMLVGVLWAVTVGLAGLVLRAFYSKLSEMTESIEDIAETVTELGKGHARVEERVDAAVRRLDRLERIEDERETH